VVLTIHVVRQGGHHYYVQDLVPGRAEGSLVAGEEPGVWSGAGATVLGLTGRVESAPFGEVLEGRHPQSGQALRATRGDRSSAGYDLTFAAPKSVSVLHLLAPGELATAAGTGHQVAVADALDYLAREGVGVRRSRGGEVAFLPTTGPVAGQFLHRTSRALDPHLHTHVVVANVAQGVDGRWSGVDSRRLHAHLPAAQSVYHARLRFELGDRMGASWHVQPSGLGDVIGVEPTLCRLFSQRAASMDEYRFQRADTSDRTPGAYFSDRPEKDRSVTVDELRDRWRERAADLGLDLGDLTRTVGARRFDAEPRIDRDRLHHQLVELTSHRTVGRQHVVAAVAASIPGGAVGRDVEAVATRLLEACGPVDGPSPDRSPVGRGWDPSALVRAVDGRGFDRVVSVPERGAREAHPADRARSGPEIDRTVGLGRSRQVAAPDPLVRSLGLER
jgi:conjugative relaxase-like TrwC/TraI family protein